MPRHINTSTGAEIAAQDKTLNKPPYIVFFKDNAQDQKYDADTNLKSKRTLPMLCIHYQIADL